MNSTILSFKYLGTAAAEGWPGVFCNCKSCADAQAAGGKNLRLRSSALINGELLCDLSPDLATYKMRYNIDMQALKAIVITHTHADHFNPQILSYNYKSFSANPVNLNIYCSGFARQKLLNPTSYENPAATNNLNITEVKPFTTYNTEGDYKLTPLPANHSAPESYVYIIEKDGIKVFYCTDTYILPPETMEYLQGQALNMVSFDATMGLRREGYKRHFSFYDIIDTQRQLINSGALTAQSVVVATHFSHFIALNHNEIEKFFRPYGICAAYDGMELMIK